MEDKKKQDKYNYDNNFIKNNYDNLRITTAKGNKTILMGFCKERGITLTSLVNELLKNHLSKYGYTLYSKISDKQEASEK